MTSVRQLSSPEEQVPPLTVMFGSSLPVCSTATERAQASPRCQGRLITFAAIDNVTRKLLQDRQRPVAVGFFFALGHSTIVTIVDSGRCGGRPNV